LSQNIKEPCQPNLGLRFSQVKLDWRSNHVNLDRVDSTQGEVHAMST